MNDINRQKSKTTKRLKAYSEFYYESKKKNKTPMTEHHQIMTNLKK